MYHDNIFKYVHYKTLRVLEMLIDSIWRNGAEKKNICEECDLSILSQKDGGIWYRG